MKSRLSCLLCSALCFQPALADSTREVDVFILAGQSNAMGQGAHVRDLPAALQCSQDDIYFADQFDWGWRKLDPPNTARRGEPLEPRGFGPEVTFARRIADGTGQDVYLFKFTQGGTSLSGDWLGEGGLYPSMVNVGQGIIESLENRGVRGRVRAFLWMQGESDANAAMAPEYGKNLRRLTTMIRRDFKDPELPIILGRISDFTDAPEWERVRRAQVDWARSDPAGYWVNTDAFDVVPGDRIHFDSPGIMDLGHAFAERYLVSHLGIGGERGGGDDEQDLRTPADIALEGAPESIPGSGSFTFAVRYSAPEKVGMLVSIHDEEWNWKGDTKINDVIGAGEREVAVSYTEVGTPSARLIIRLMDPDADWWDNSGVVAGSYPMIKIAPSVSARSVAPPISGPGALVLE